MAIHGKCGREFRDSYSHCGGCCETFLAAWHFDQHRQSQFWKYPWTCNPLLSTLGFVKVDGVWGPPESHAQRSALAERMKTMRRG